MGIGALFEHENHRGTGLKLIADRFLLLIVRKMLDVTKEQQLAEDLALDKHLQRLAELRDLAMEKGNYAAAIHAEIAMGKVSGLPELAKVKIMEMKERKKNEEEKEVRIVLF